MSRFYLKNFVWQGMRSRNECIGDADYDIAQATLDQSLHSTTVLDAIDTVLLVILVSAENVPDNLVMKLSTGRYRISAIKRSLKENVVKYLSVAHAMSGCDSTSSLFRKGKIHAFKVLDNNNDLSFLDVFKANNSRKEQIASAGEKFLLLMYNAPKTCQSLNNLRFMDMQETS